MSIQSSSVKRIYNSFSSQHLRGGAGGTADVYKRQTLYHKDFTEIDGGQIDNPEISMNAARDQILSDYGFGGRTMTRIVSWYLFKMISVITPLAG